MLTYKAEMRKLAELIQSMHSYEYKIQDTKG